MDERSLELIHGRADGALDPAAAKEAEAILTTDPAVRALADDLARLDAAFRSIPRESPPAGFRDRVLQAIRDHRGTTSPFRKGVRPQRTWLALAAVLVLGVGLASIWMVKMSDVTPGLSIGTIGAQPRSTSWTFAEGGVEGTFHLDVSGREVRAAGVVRGSGKIGVELRVPGSSSVWTAGGVGGARIDTALAAEVRAVQVEVRRDGDLVASRLMESEAD